MGTITSSPTPPIDSMSLVKDVAMLNVAYLAISITIVLAFFGIFIFFNFKPLQEKISEQEEGLMSDRKSNEEKLRRLTADMLETQKNNIDQIENLRQELTRTIDSKVTAAEKRIQALEILAKQEIEKMKRVANLIELKNLWDKYYLWTLGELKVHANALLVLTQYLEESIQYNVWVASPELCFNAIDDTLNAMKGARHVSDNYDRDLYNRLVNALTKLDGYEERKTETLKKAKDVLLGSN